LSSGSVFPLAVLTLVDARRDCPFFDFLLNVFQKRASVDEAISYHRMALKFAVKSQEWR